MTAPLSPIQLPKLSGVKRRIIPLATTAAAALTLTACGVPERMLGMEPLIPTEKAPAPFAPAISSSASAVSPSNTSIKMDAFTADAAAALQSTDLQKIKSASDKKPAQQVILAETHSAEVPHAIEVMPDEPRSVAMAPVPLVGPAPVAPVMTPTPIVTTPIPPANPVPMQLHVLDGPPGVTVNTNLPTSTTVAIPAGYTVYSPTKEPMRVNSASEVDPALAGIIDRGPEPTPEAALEVLRKQFAARPTLNTALALALLDEAEGKVRDTKMPQRLNAVDQQIYQDMLASLDNLNATPLPTATLTERAAPLVDAMKKWQTEADLTLPKLALATRVESYGVYTPVEAKFKAGERHTVIIYCEVANFSAKKSSDNWYETRLSQQETLATDDGLLLWRPNPEVVEDRSLNQRRDFYLVKKLTIPDNLAVGKYALRMSVTDLNTNKIAVVNLPIEITK